MIKKTPLFCLIFLQFYGFSQTEDAWVFLNAKSDVANALANPLTILTQDAIDRKALHSVAIDFRDVPVDESYISTIKGATGITVMSKSKWLNAVHVRGTETNINNLLPESFVDHIEFADQSLNSSRMFMVRDKFEIENAQVVFVYGTTQNQVEMINADNLHLADYTGTGKLIAVLDAGFPNVDTMGAFQRLRDDGNLHGGYDFVDGTSDVYANTSSDHGTKVLSDMAGYIDTQFVGTAPDAGYYLFRTEAAGFENPVEESYWVEAAERADSLGVDIINSSLGYKDFFDESKYNYSAAEMDGYTAYITRGANIAFEKGLLVVNSAGNEGVLGVNAPADSPNVLSVGAVDAAGIISSFSSRGSAIQPSQKPDVLARGSGSYVVSSSNTIVQNNGTSFSSPIMAGGVACLWQAVPNKTNAEIMDYLRQAGDNYDSPDYTYGYGIPDLEEALNTALSVQNENLESLSIFPNPVRSTLHFNFPKDTSNLSLELYDVLGKRVMKATIWQEHSLLDLNQLSRGIYIAKLQSTDHGSKTFKLIKE